MAKYDNQIAEAKNLLPNAKNILIAVSAGANIDKLAGALALSLALEASQKQVSIVCDDTIQVAQSHLFGIDKVQKTFTSAGGGDFVLTLEGVAVPDQTTETGWKVPALSTMDYVAENNNLNLVFHVIPGQTFQPTGIVPHFQGSGFNLIITVGAPDLNSLGGVYSQNQAAFSGVSIINIDNSGNNTSFGQTNVVDSNAASVSEMLVDLIPSLGLPFDGDIASNLLAGVFSATNNLTTPNMNADTFMAVANCLRVGGKKPQANEVPAGQGLDLSALMQNSPVQQPQPEAAPAPVAAQPQFQPAPQPAPVQLAPEQTFVPEQNSFTNPPVIPNPVVPQPQPTSTQPLAPEAPRGEAASTGTEIEAEPDWLTPKIFKAGQG